MQASLKICTRFILFPLYQDFVLSYCFVHIFQNFILALSNFKLFEKEKRKGKMFLVHFEIR